MDKQILRARAYLPDRRTAGPCLGGATSAGPTTRPIGNRFFAVTLDCPDPYALASFYREIVGGDLRSSNDDSVVLGRADGGVRLDFQRVRNPEPAPWPEPTAARRLHLDFALDDLDEAESHHARWGLVARSCSTAVIAPR